MHNDHSSHPDVDRLFCRNGTRIVVAGKGRWTEKVTIDGTEFTTGMEVGRDCSGATRADKTGLESEPAIGLVEMLSGTGGGKWPKVSKEATWGVSGAFLDNWGRSEEVREKEKNRIADERGLTYWWRHCSRQNVEQWDSRCKRYFIEQNKMHERWDTIIKSYEQPAKAAWLAANPGWLDEERRRLEVDASSQIAGEIADMGTEIKAVCEVN